MRLESEIDKHIIHKLEQERDMYKRNWDKTLKERDRYDKESYMYKGYWMKSLSKCTQLETENEQLRIKNIGLERALVRANETIDILRKALLKE